MTGWSRQQHTLEGFIATILPSLDKRHYAMSLGKGGFTLRRKSGGSTNGIEIQFSHNAYCEIQIRDKERFAQITGLCDADGQISLKSVDLGKFINHHEQITHRYIWQGDADTAPRTARFQRIEPEIATLDALRLEATRVAIDHVATALHEGQAPYMSLIEPVFNPRPILDIPPLGPYRLSARRIAARRKPKSPRNSPGMN